MLKFYLLINSFSYVLFSVWCLIKPTSTANYLGLGFLKNSGKIEYLSVYTGMEMGFAVFLALCGLYPSLSLAGLIFCVSIYLGLMFTRTFTAMYYGNVSTATYLVGSSEYIFGIWGVIILVLELRKLNVI